MPTIDKLTQSDIDTIAKLQTGKISGLSQRTPSMRFSGCDIVGVDTTSKPDLFIKKETKKRKVVLHGTIGLIASDLPTLTSQKQMTTNYLVARDGTILEIYDPHYWAYHIGAGCVGGNGVMSAESISIEISNYGPLEFKNLGNTGSPSDDKFYNVYKTLYGTGNERMDASGFVVQGGAYPSVVKLANAYRGYIYYASITEKQYQAVNALLKGLTQAFGIPMSAIEFTDRFKVFADNAKAKDFQGICSHINFRPMGKWDIGPWADWDKITNQSGDASTWKDTQTNTTEEAVTGMKVLTEEKFDGKQDNWSYTDTIDPITGGVIETAEAKKTRVLKENNPLICSL